MRLQQLIRIMLFPAILGVFFTSCISSSDSSQVSVYLDINQTWNMGADNSKDDFSIDHDIYLDDTKPDLSEMDFEKGRLLFSGFTVKSEELKSGDKILLLLTTDDTEKFEVPLTTVEDKTKEIYATIDHQNSEYARFADNMINKLVRNEYVGLQVSVKIVDRGNIPFKYAMSNAFEVNYK